MMKKLITTLCTLSLLIAPTVTAFAASTSIYETESNDSIATAQEVSRNIVTAANTVYSRYDGQNVVKGSLSSSTDVDWYKVYLPEGKQTLSINSTALSSSGIWNIYDSDGNLIDAIHHTQNSSKYPGATPYTVTIPSSNLYYIEVTSGSSNSSGSYLFTIGNPNYSVDGVSYTASSPLKLTTTTSSTQGTYDLNSLNVPDNAIAYAVSIEGSTTNNATNQSRNIKASSDSSWITTSAYTYNADIPVINNKYVKDKWTVNLTGNVSKYSNPFTLYPKLHFSYVYAIVPNFEK